MLARFLYRQWRSLASVQFHHPAIVK